MAAAGVIVAAIIAALATGASAGISSASQKESQAEALGLANIKRGDTLAAQKKQRALTNRSLRQQEQQSLRNIAFQTKQFDQGVAERSDERAYKRRLDRYNNAISYMNSNKNLQDRMGRYWGGAQ